MATENPTISVSGSRELPVRRVCQFTMSHSSPNMEETPPIYKYGITCQLQQKVCVATREQCAKVVDSKTSPGTSGWCMTSHLL